MAISKLIFNGETQMDVTQNTVASGNLLANETATGADGEQVVGAYAVPTGTKQITENGTGIDVSAFEFADVNVSGGGGYYAEGTYTMTEGTRYFSVSVSFQPKFAYAFVSNWRELGHTSWRRLLLVGKLDGEYQRGQLSSRYLNNAYGSSGNSTDSPIASYSNGTLTFDSSLNSTTYFPDGAEIVWFAAGNGGA